MSAVVRRLSSVTPEAVANRRASYGALNLPSQLLDATPLGSDRRRASIGPSESPFLTPSDSFARCGLRRTSLCLPDAEAETPSVAYLSRKRASLDNTWLTQWIRPDENSTKQQVGSHTSVEHPHPTLSQCFHDAEDCASPVHQTPAEASKRKHLVPKQTSQYTINQDVCCHKSPLCNNCFTNANASAHSNGKLCNQRTVCLSPTSQTLAKPPDSLFKKIDFSSPHIAFSPFSNNLNDNQLDRAFSQKLTDLQESPRLQSCLAIQNELVCPGQNQPKVSPSRSPQWRCFYGQIDQDNSPEANLLKARNGPRKRSSPSIIFPALSPCLEDIMKNSKFPFDVAREKEGNCFINKEENLKDLSSEEGGLCLQVKDSRNIPEIMIDTVDNDGREGKIATSLTDACKCSGYSEHRHLLSSSRVGVWWLDLKQTPPCIHCCRRRCSLETQSPQFSNASPKLLQMGLPLTPQPWQFQSHFHHRHNHIQIPRMAQRQDFASTAKSKGRVLAGKESKLLLAGSIIGRGGFGTVKLGCYRGMNVAVKILKGQRAAVSAFREAHALTIQPHVHLTSTYAVVTPTASEDFASIMWASYKEKQQEEIVPVKMLASLFGLSMTDATYTGKDEHGNRGPEWAWVVSELCTPHTLLSLIDDPDVTLTTKEKIRYSGELVSGLSYLHSQDLVHLDVKPANALLTQTGHVRLGDYGCCSRLNEEGDQNVLGTVSYQAPEVLRGKGGTDRSDIFSLGVTMWHLLTRNPPYQGLHPHVVLYKVTSLCHRPTDHYTFPGTFTILEELLNRLIERCWVEDPNQRPSASAVSDNLAALYFSPVM